MNPKMSIYSVQHSAVRY